MTRLSLDAYDPDDEIIGAVFAAFAEEGRDPIALYRVLAHSPRMLEAYSVLARSLRNDATTPRAVRELMILRTAQLTGSDYEWSHHRAMVDKLGLIEEASVRELWRWRESTRFTARDRAVLRCADEMHERALSPEAFGALREWFEPAEIIELVLVAGFYQAVARVLQALEVEVEQEYHAYLDGRNGHGDAVALPTDPDGRR